MATEYEMLFRGFSRKERDAFLTIGQEQQHLPGESLVQDEASSFSVFILLEGAASVLKGNVRVATLQKGNVFGEAALFQNQRRTATVQAETSIRVLEFRRQDVFNYFKWREERLFKLFVFNIVTILLGKLRRANARVAYLEEQLHEQALSVTGGDGDEHIH